MSWTFEKQKLDLFFGIGQAYNMTVTQNDRLGDICNIPPLPTLLKFNFINWDNLIFKKEISQTY